MVKGIEQREKSRHASWNKAAVYVTVASGLAIASILQASCIREKSPNSTEVPPSTPVVLQVPDGKTEDPLEKQKKVIYSKLMDDIEASVAEKGYYFIKSGEKNEAKDSRVFLLPKSIPDFPSPDRNTHILMSQDGIESFSVLKQANLSYDFINDVEQSIIDAARSGNKPTSQYIFALGKHIDGSESVSYYNKSQAAQAATEINSGSIDIDTKPLTNDQVKKVIAESQEMVRYFTELGSQKKHQDVQSAIDLSGTLEPLLKPHQRSNPSPLTP